MSVSVTNVLARTVKLFMSDWMLITPYLLFFLLINGLETAFKVDEAWVLKHYFFQAMIGVWVVELLIKGLTYVGANHILYTQKIHFGEAIAVVFKHYLKLLMATGLLALPFLGVLSVAQGVEKMSQDPLLLGGLLLGVIVLIPLALIASFVPFLILFKNKGVFSSISASFYFVKKQFLSCLAFIFVLFAVLMLTLLLSQSLQDVPVLGPSLLNGLVQAFGYSFMYTAMTVFFLLKYDDTTATISTTL